MAKKKTTASDESTLTLSTAEPSTAELGLVSFRTAVSWAGERFSWIPGQVVQIDEATAKDRQAAGLGEIVEERRG